MIIAIIQARMGSSRLPNKVLMEVDGKPLLRYQLDRIRKSTKIDKIVIATTSLTKDDSIVKFCEDNGVEYFRGEEDDVLSRYYLCAKSYNPKVIVRLTADCPLVDPVIIDNVIDKYQSNNVDYCSNTTPIETNTFPDGTDVEVFSFKALEKAYHNITDPHYKEHVTFQFWRTNEYSSIQYKNDRDYSSYRITVDYPEDFDVVSYIFKKLNQENLFGYLDEIITMIDENKEIKEKNSQYYMGQGWVK